MPKITDYAVITTCDPADTLIDVSTDVSTTPITRAITLEDVASALNVGSGSFYDNDGVISDALRTVDGNGGSIYFSKARIGFGTTVTAGQESYIFNQFTAGEDVAKFNVGGTEVLAVGESFIRVGQASEVDNLSAIFFGKTETYTDGTQDSIWQRSDLANTENTIAIDLSTDDKPTLNLGGALTIYNEDGVTSGIESTEEILIKGNNNGFVLEAPDTTLYRVTVSNAGALQVNAV